MNKKLFLILSCLGIFSLQTKNSWGLNTINNRLRFQGLLKAPSGQLLPDGTYKMRFTIKVGNLVKWQQVENAVTVANGIFSAEISGNSDDLGGGNQPALGGALLSFATDNAANSSTIDVEVDSNADGVFTAADDSYLAIKLAAVPMAMVCDRANNALALQGRDVYGSTPADGQSLVWNAASTRWEPGSPSSAQSTVNFSGALSGDVTGSQSATQLSSIQGVNITATGAGVKQVLAFDGSSWAPSNVSTLQGRDIYAGAPANGQSLIWNNAAARWEPGAPTTMSGSLSGDVAGLVNATSVNKLKGKSITPNSYSAGQVLTFDGTNWINTTGLGAGSQLLATDITGNAASASVANSALNVSGVVNVANGGTGVTSLSGIVRGNGGGVFSAATAGVDYQAPLSSTTDLSLRNVTARSLASGGQSAGLTIGNVGSGNLAGELRFISKTDASTNYVGFRAPALSSNTVWSLPSADGSSGQVLTTDGAGALSWGTTTTSGVAGGDLSGSYPNPTIGVGKVTSASILDGTITNVDINAAAAIAYSKLNLASSVSNADISPAAAIAYSKLSLANSVSNSDISPTAGVVYSKLNLANSISNSDISATAGIAYSKLTLANSIVTNDVANLAITNAKINDVAATKLTGALPAISGASLTNLSASSVSTGVLPEARGGTNQSSYAVGDMLYASAANTLSKLPVGASASLLTSSGTSPQWQSAAAAGVVDTSTAQAVAGAKTFSGATVFSNASPTTFNNGVALTSAGPGNTPLNYYEEGTINPTYSGSGTTGACTYTTQVGNFVRVGKMVTFSINLVWTACGTSPVGTPQIGSLPCLSKNSAGLIQSVNVTPLSNTYTSGTPGTLVGHIQPNSQFVQIKVATPTSNSALIVAAVDTAAALQVSGSYICN